jgi:hypothetical protein
VARRHDDELDLDFDEFDDLEPTYQIFRRRTPSLGLVLPVIVLIVVVAIVSGLVLGGVIQGNAVREAGSGAPTTQSTVQIAP